MKIYFCGSIRGGRDDLSLYRQLVAHMQHRHGTVLTEHIVADDPTKAMLCALGKTADCTDLDDTTIYATDMGWLRQCDGSCSVLLQLGTMKHRSWHFAVVVAEVTQPSTGVGYELGQAVALGKRVLCLHRATAAKRAFSEVSSMRTRVCAQVCRLWWRARSPSTARRSKWLLIKAPKRRSRQLMLFYNHVIVERFCCQSLHRSHRINSLIFLSAILSVECHTRDVDESPIVALSFSLAK